MATIDIPGDIIFPKSDDLQIVERDKILVDYMVQIRQSLEEIESKLP